MVKLFIIVRWIKGRKKIYMYMYYEIVFLIKLLLLIYFFLIYVVKEVLFYEKRYCFRILFNNII